MIYRVTWTDMQGAQLTAYCDDDVSAQALLSALRGDRRLCATGPSMTTMEEEKEEHE